MKKFLKLVFLAIYLALSVCLLIYLILPGPTSITDFPAMPNSHTSTLSGDTVQVPNVVAYFSDNYRDFVIPFYSNAYKTKAKLPFDPIRFNYPPQFAYTAIKDQTQSTYLEELTYPLRDTLFVNGMEPFTKDGKHRFEGATLFVHDGEHETKVTLRFYPSSRIIRILVWGGINASFVVLWLSFRKVILNA